MALGKIPGTNLYGQSITVGTETVWTVAHQNLDANGLGISTNPGSAARLISSAATTNATLVKAGSTNLHKINGNNTVASKRYLKLYNKASAPTVGTDTPVVTLVILASAAFDISLNGLVFPLGLGFAITGSAADADTTAIGAGDIEAMNLLYT